MHWVHSPALVPPYLPHQVCAILHLWYTRAKLRSVPHRHVLLMLYYLLEGIFFPFPPKQQNNFLKPQLTHPLAQMLPAHLPHQRATPPSTQPPETVAPGPCHCFLCMAVMHPCLFSPSPLPASLRACEGRTTSVSSLCSNGF